jgi:hypothetical protein
MLRRAQHERLIYSIGLREIMEEYVFSIMDSLVSVSFSPGFLASWLPGFLIENRGSFYFFGIVILLDSLINHRSIIKLPYRDFGTNNRAPGMA